MYLQRGALANFPQPQWKSGVAEGTSVLLEFYDDNGVSVASAQVEAGDEGIIEVDFSGSDFSQLTRFDGDYAIYGYTVEDDSEEVWIPVDTILTDTLYVYRPYFDPYQLDGDEEEIQEYVRQERAARLLIDDCVSGGFYYRRVAEPVQGFGSDTLSVNNRFIRVNYVYENNTLIYNRTDPIDGQTAFYATRNHYSIVRDVNGEFNRAVSRSVGTHWLPSDAHGDYSADYDSIVGLGTFGPNGFYTDDYDYIIFGEAGYPVVPVDIQEAAKILMDEFATGKRQYTDSFITEYSTDQFKIKYGGGAFKATGNLIVDKTLRNYSGQLGFIGVL